MSKEMMMIFTKEEIERIKENPDGICLDLHRLSVKQSKRLVNNVISMNRDNFSLTLIHGYVHGTAIKEMLVGNFDNPRVIGKHGVKNNYGRTVFDIIAA